MKNRKLLFIVVVLMLLTSVSAVMAGNQTCDPATWPWKIPEFAEWANQCVLNGGNLSCHMHGAYPRIECIYPTGEVKPYELPRVPEDLLTIVSGPFSGPPYREVIDVPEGKYRIFTTYSNRVPLYFSQKIRGWSADLQNSRVIYGVSKQCFGEALAEKPMMYNVHQAKLQEDNQFWLKLSNEQAILTSCEKSGTITPQELLDIRISPKSVEYRSSGQGDPWMFKGTDKLDFKLVE
ncbi:MAG: hypothetical protein ACOX6Q_00250 [Candidatus Dojkabacteria bacterium]